MSYADDDKVKSSSKRGALCFTSAAWYFNFKFRIMPISIGCRLDVVLGGRNCSEILEKRC